MCVTSHDLRKRWPLWLRLTTLVFTSCLVTGCAGTSKPLAEYDGRFGAGDTLGRRVHAHAMKDQRGDQEAYTGVDTSNP